MTGTPPPSALRLVPYQEELLRRLEPLVARLDPSKITAESGLTTEWGRKVWEVSLVVEARDARIPGLYLSAGPTWCVLEFAQSEQVEYHSDPGSVKGLVERVVGLIERYLSAVTLVQHKDRRGRVLRIDYSFGVPGEAEAGSAIGTARFPNLFRSVDHTETLSYRFLKHEVNGRAPR
ncbi:MAG TPA: hypothetical protein VMT19_10510 [Thermoanaerobaculaceae bacterium]|nr:hypothetical protein [Thermoanaerobaculaceae bacterium]